jgi:hypothetical protein
MVILAALVVFGAIFVPSAFAECGPGFHNKKELIEIVKKNPSIANGLRKELLAHPEYEYNADETVLNYLREPSQKVEKTPPGYKLSRNTWCPGGFGHYKPYGGLLENMPGKVMLWHVNKADKAFPIMKGYCMNAVGGPSVQKKTPKSPPKHKPRKRKKCGCKRKKPKPAPKCSTKSPNGGGGNCNEQVVTTTVTPEQKCGAENHSSAGGCTQTTTTVTNVYNCSNGNNENTGSTINNGGNCNNGGTETCVGQSNCSPHEEETCVNNSCNPTPPPKEECGCKPEEPEEPEKPKSPPKVELETINDFEVKEPGTICARTIATAGDSLSVTFFAKGGGEFHNHGVGKLRPGTTNEWCAEYTASSEAGTSIIKVVVQDNTTGLSGEDEQSVRNKPETSF